jgi:hypothetical protein
MSGGGAKELDAKGLAVALGATPFVLSSRIGQPLFPKRRFDPPGTLQPHPLMVVSWSNISVYVERPHIENSTQKWSAAELE